MAFLMMLSVLLLLLLSVLCSADGRPTCRSGEFRSLNPGSGITCQPCTVCPVNEIIRRPCSQLSDTICGPLYDFEFFNMQKHVGAAGTSAPGAAEKSSTRSLTDGSSEPPCSLYVCVSGAVCIGLMILLTTFIVVKTCRPNGSCFIHKPRSPGVQRTLIVGEPTGERDATAVHTAVFVDDDLRHLETQVYNNNISRHFRSMFFGVQPDHLGNDYVDELTRLRMTRQHPAVDNIPPPAYEEVAHQYFELLPVRQQQDLMLPEAQPAVGRV